MLSSFEQTAPLSDGLFKADRVLGALGTDDIVF